MTKDELVARLHDIEWDDFEVKAAKSNLPKKHLGDSQCILQLFRRMDCAWSKTIRTFF